MSTAGILRRSGVSKSQKPRWLKWEGACLEAAFQENIPLKTIAFVLQKSLTAVSKKITSLGLRKRSTHCGRLKGKCYKACKENNGFQDVCKMADLLKTYVPSSFGCPRLENIAFLVGGAGLKTAQENCSYSLGQLLSYTLLEEKEVNLPGVERGYDHSLYVPFYYIEKWAYLKGFQKVPNRLHARGLWYWKEGEYFSPAQVLFYLNEIRLEKKLPPLHLHED